MPLFLTRAAMGIQAPPRGAKPSLRALSKVCLGNAAMLPVSMNFGEELYMGPLGCALVIDTSRILHPRGAPCSKRHVGEAAFLRALSFSNLRPRLPVFHKPTLFHVRHLGASFLLQDVGFLLSTQVRLSPQVYQPVQRPNQNRFKKDTEDHASPTVDSP